MLKQRNDEFTKNLRSKNNYSLKVFANTYYFEFIKDVLR